MNLEEYLKTPRKKKEIEKKLKLSSYYEVESLVKSRTHEKNKNKVKKLLISNYGSFLWSIYEMS